MVVKSFYELSHSERSLLYVFIKDSGTNYYFSTFEEMVDDCSGDVFRGGKGYFTFWADGSPRGTLAVIEREIAVKGEGIITSINVSQGYEYCFGVLLDKGLEYVMQFKPRVMKLGLYPSISFAEPNLISRGFKIVYEAHVMKHNRENVISSNTDGKKISFIPMGRDNMDDYKNINNASFVNSPNGATLTNEDMLELLEEYKDKPEMAGICMYNEVPSCIYQLSMSGKVGWIDALAVHPDFQGLGLGKVLLKKSIDILNSLGVEEIKLVVISSNKNAYSLYSKNGFKLENIRSKWFERVEKDEIY